MEELQGEIQMICFSVMTRVHYFIVDLAKGGKSFGDIKKLVDDV
jgi:hypothetical protein